MAKKLTSVLVRVITPSIFIAIFCNARLQRCCITLSMEQGFMSEWCRLLMDEPLTHRLQMTNLCRLGLSGWLFMVSGDGSEWYCQRCCTSSASICTLSASLWSFWAALGNFGASTLAEEAMAMIRLLFARALWLRRFTTEMRRNRRSFMTCQVQGRLGTAMVANQKEFSPRQTTEWYEMCGVLGLLLCGVKSGPWSRSRFLPPRLRLEKDCTQPANPRTRGIFRALRRDITHFTVATQKASGARAPPPMTHTYRLFTHYTTMPARPVLGSISGNIPRKKELTPLRTRYYCWEGFCQYRAYPNCRGAFHTAFNGSRDSLPRRHVSSSFWCTKKVVKAWQISYFTKGATDHVCAAHPRAHPCRLAQHHLPTTQGPPYNQLACKIASFTYRGVYKIHYK